MCTDDILIRLGFFIGAFWSLFAAILIGAWTAYGISCGIQMRRRHHYDEAWRLTLDTVERWCAQEFPQVGETTAYLRRIAFDGTHEGIDTWKTMLRVKYERDYSE